MARFRAQVQSPALWIALVALFVALGGTSYAATTLLPRNSVGTKQVVDHSLLKADFKAGQLLAGPRGSTGARMQAPVNTAIRCGFAIGPPKSCANPDAPPSTRTR